MINTLELVNEMYKLLPDEAGELIPVLRTVKFIVENASYFAEHGMDQDIAEKFFGICKKWDAYSESRPETPQPGDRVNLVYSDPASVSVKNALVDSLYGDDKEVALICIVPTVPQMIWMNPIKIETRRHLYTVTSPMVNPEWCRMPFKFAIGNSSALLFIDLMVYRWELRDCNLI